MIEIWRKLERTNRLPGFACGPLAKTFERGICNH